MIGTVDRLRRTLVLGMALGAAVASGCGDKPTRAVSGLVTFAGTPVEKGDIVFIPVDGTGGPSTGGDIEQGAYQVPADKGPRAGGVYRVEITSMVKSSRTIPNPISPQGPPGDVYENTIPPKYNAQSELKVTIQGDGPYDFDLPATGTPRGP